jgi:hypothetical protein
MVPTPHLLDHYPRLFGVKAVLALPSRLSRCRVHDELTQFRYCFTFYILRWLLPSVLSSTIVLISSPSDSQLDEEFRFYAQEF